MRLVLMAAMVCGLTAPTAALCAPAKAEAAKAPYRASAKLELGIAMAKLAQPEDVVIPASLDAFDKALAAILKKDQSFAELETKFPGIAEKMSARMKPILESALRKRLPTMWQRMGEVYARELTDKQITDLTAFLSSPAGQKFINAMNRKADVSALLEDLDKSDGKISKDGFSDVTRTAAVGAVDELTPTEQADLLRFATGDLMAAMKRVGPLVMEITRAWANEADPETDKQMELVASSLVEEFSSNN